MQVLFVVGVALGAPLALAAIYAIPAAGWLWLMGLALVYGVVVAMRGIGFYWEDLAVAYVLYWAATRLNDVSERILTIARIVPSS